MKLIYTQVKKLITRDLLPAFIGRKTGSGRRALLVDPADLTVFLEQYQTIRTTACQLDISENAARARITRSSLVRAAEGDGLPIYRTVEILAT